MANMPAAKPAAPAQTPAPTTPPPANAVAGASGAPTATQGVDLKSGLGGKNDAIAGANGGQTPPGAVGGVAEIMGQLTALLTKLMEMLTQLVNSLAKPQGDPTQSPVQQSDLKSTGGGGKTDPKQNAAQAASAYRGG